VPFRFQISDIVEAVTAAASGEEVEDSGEEEGEGFDDEVSLDVIDAVRRALEGEELVVDERTGLADGGGGMFGEMVERVRRRIDLEDEEVRSIKLRFLMVNELRMLANCGSV
jgi:hypothetical protein